MTRTLYVDKASGTFADPLLAFGLAVMFGDVLARTGAEDRGATHLRDEGAYYRLDFAQPLDDGRLAAFPLRYTPAYTIRTEKNATNLPADLPPASVVDYEAERDRRSEYFELRKNLPAAALGDEGASHPARAVLRASEPHPDWDVFRAVNPSSLVGYNKLMTQWWRIQNQLPDVLRLLRDLFAQSPNDILTAINAWKVLDKLYGWDIAPQATSAQIYNPSQGKGQHHPKASKLHKAGKNLKNFWLVEWLKAVGFYRAALTKQLRGVKDRKTYVLAPLQLDLGESDGVMAAFRGYMVRAESAIRSDVLASIRYTRAMLEYSQERAGSSLLARLFERRRPNRVVAGLHSAFYKDLGNAVATMNLAFIGLPAWISVEEQGDVGDALAILAEHEAIVRQFDETHSDAYNLLLLYRDFVSANDLTPFFGFTTAYSSYLISQRERQGRRARQFTTQNLGRLIMNVEPRLGMILESEGFQNIAYAIRQSTVVAQYRKQQGDRRYDVRYGLGMDLARKANYPADFVAALGDFLHKYNAENAQVMERRSGPFRRSVRTSDIDEIVALVDEHSAPLVCNLLVAYGYARSPRPESVDDEDATDEAE